MTPFPFDQLSDTQQTVVHHHLSFSQKWHLRRVAKIFTRRPAHHFLMVTRFRDVLVTAAKPKYTTRSSDIMVVNRDPASNSSLYIQIGNSGGPMQFKHKDHVEHQKSTAEQFVTLLRAERQLYRQPSKVWLTFGANGNEWEKSQTPAHYQLIFEEVGQFFRRLILNQQVAHIPEIWLGMRLKGDKHWQTASDALMAIIEAALVTNRPAPGADRLLDICFRFNRELNAEVCHSPLELLEHDDVFQPDYRLPAALQELLRLNTRVVDEVFIYRHTQLCPGQPRHGAGRRYDRIQVLVAQNHRLQAGWTIEGQKKWWCDNSGEWHSIWSSRQSITAWY
ncbi:unnamed protein product, partial [Mesorhabditis spiculigera]